MMTEYNEILKAMGQLPDMSETDIVNAERMALNPAAHWDEVDENAHLVICISRTQGSAGNDIGFELADKLHINYYDSEIFEQVLKRQEEGKNFILKRKSALQSLINMGKKRETLKSKLRNMYRYHGLNREDAIFFHMSDLGELLRIMTCALIVLTTESKRR